MKRQWDIEELIEHFTLVADDEELLANKTGVTRLGFALLLKCFQLEGKFPQASHEIPKDVVNYVAHQLKLDGSLFAQYDWEGRTIKLHRMQIHEQYQFREATNADTEDMTAWLISTKLAADQNMEHLKVKVAERFRELKIEPPSQSASNGSSRRRVQPMSKSSLRRYSSASPRPHGSSSMPCLNDSKTKKRKRNWKRRSQAPRILIQRDIRGDPLARLESQPGADWPLQCAS